MSTIYKRAYLQGIVIPSLHSPPSTPFKSATPCQFFKYDQVTAKEMKPVKPRGKVAPNYKQLGLQLSKTEMTPEPTITIDKKYHA